MLGNVRTRTLSKSAKAIKIRSPAAKSSIATLYSAQITHMSTKTNKISFQSGHCCHGTANSALIWPTDQVQIICTK